MRQGSSLIEQAESLVPAAEIWAITCHKATDDELSALEQVPFKDWVFFVTVGGVCVAVSGLVGRIDDDLFRHIYTEVIEPALTKWNPVADAALMDCRRFLHEAEQSGGDLTPVDALGAWVLFNLLQRGRDLSAGEIQLTRPLGGLMASAFADWWDDCPEVQQRR